MSGNQGPKQGSESKPRKLNKSAGAGGARAQSTGAGGKRSAKPGGRMQQEFSAGFILFRDTPQGRVYLLLDYGRHWDYAKGHLEEGETAWRAAVRELREETGIKQVDRVGRFERDMHYVFFSPKKGRVHKTVTFFLGKTTTSEVKLSEEHTGFAWLGYEEAMQRLTYDNAREMLRAAEETFRVKG